MNSKGRFFIVESYDLPKEYIKGTVGAGDAFCAGMLYALYNDWEMYKSLRFANLTAACCLGHENSISGMRTIEEMEKLGKTLTIKRKLNIK